MSDMVERVALLAATAFLASCSPTPKDAAPAQRVTTKAVNQADGVSVWRDPETGCEYLTIYSKGITPRYAKGGSSYEQQHVKGCRYAN